MPCKTEGWIPHLVPAVLATRPERTANGSKTSSARLVRRPFALLSDLSFFNSKALLGEYLVDDIVGLRRFDRA